MKFRSVVQTKQNFVRLSKPTIWNPNKTGSKLVLFRYQTFGTNRMILNRTKFCSVCQTKQNLVPFVKPNVRILDVHCSYFNSGKINTVSFWNPNFPISALFIVVPLWNISNFGHCLKSALNSTDFRRSIFSVILFSSFFY